MLPWSAELAGRIDEHVITSELLRATRWVTPASGRSGSTCRRATTMSPARAYPSVYVIQGYTGHVAMWRNRSAYRQPFPETADAVFADGQAPPAIVVYVNAWTAYGGSQFVNSPGTGRYHSYLCDEVVPWVDGRYRTLADAGHRAIMGKSSGGFGAMITPMLRPDLFGALATHAGRLAVRVLLRPRVRQGRAPPARLRRGHLALVGRLPVPHLVHQGGRQDLLMLLGVSACFSADPDGTVELPFDPHTGVLRPQVWQRWLDWDPVRMVPALRRPAEVAAGDLDRRRDQGRMVPRHGGAGVPRGAAGGGRARRGDPLRAVRGHATWGSTTATRCRSPGSASASRPERRCPLPLSPRPAAGARLSPSRRTGGC